MAYTVLVRMSPHGDSVHVLRDDQSLQGGDRVHYRLVCRTEDEEEAERAAGRVREGIVTVAAR